MNAGAEALPDLTDRSGYPHWTTDRIRFSDTDMAMHVNNVAFAAYAETGRLALMRGHIAPLCRPGERFIAASVTVNFLRETQYPGEVEIGTRVIRIGRTSITVGQGIFKDNVCVASATGAVVHLNADGPTPLTDIIRAEAEKWLGA